ncbi:MAG: capsule assembly Wzi family protein [Spirochaetaceae bacterium]|nr:capsule assembly Wzi family protein [Spirochaetaceae bacterium]
MSPLVLFFMVLRLYAEPMVMISAGDPLLDDLRFLLREAGISFTSFTPPFSGYEIRGILQDLNPAALSGPGLAAYGRIMEGINPKLLLPRGIFNLSLGAQTAPEIRFRTNTEVYWIRGIHDSPAFLKIPVNLFFTDRLLLNAEPMLTSEPSSYEDEGVRWNTNLPYLPERVDLNLPLRAFAAAAGPWWSFQIGRDRLSFGPGKTGNLALSDTPDFYDFGRISFFSPHFKYSFLISQLPLATDTLFAPGFGPASSGELTQTTRRYLYLHRIDLRFFRRLSLGFTEGIMAGNSPVELRFFTPLGLFHSFFAWNDYEPWQGMDPRGNTREGSLVGSLFSFDLEWAVLPSLALYGQLVMNEFSTSYEKNRWPDTQPPNGLGYLAGLEYNPGFTFWRASFYGELVYTDPYLYVLSSPFASFISMRRLPELGDKELRYRWIGHPQGRDTMLIALGADFLREPWGFALGLSFIRKGEHTIRWDWSQGKDSFSEVSPTGRPEHIFTAQGAGTWNFLPGFSLKFYAALSMIFDRRRQERTGPEFGLETALSLSYSRSF